MKLKPRVVWGVSYTQTKGCRFCLHIFDCAMYFGQKERGAGARLELFTPLHVFRFRCGSAY